MWADMGTLESGSLVDEDGNGIDDFIDDLRLLKDHLIAKGFVEGEDLVVYEDPGARHNEGAWSERFPDVLRYLFPSEGTGVPVERASVGSIKGRY
jgi:hypothetical protein